MEQTFNAFANLNAMTEQAWNRYRQGFIDSSLYLFLAQERDEMNKSIDAFYHANFPADDC